MKIVLNEHENVGWKICSRSNFHPTRCFFIQHDFLFFCYICILLHRFNISSNMAFLLRWMNCWIGLTRPSYCRSQVQINRQNIHGLSSNNFYTLSSLLNSIQKEEYTPNTKLIQKQLFSKKSFLELRKIHMKTTLLESLFNSVGSLKAWNLIKKRLQHWYFGVNFVQFFKKPYLQNTFEWLLLVIPPFLPTFYPLITLCLFFPLFIFFYYW